MDELLEALIVELKVPKRRRGKNIGNTSVPQKRQAGLLRTSYRARLTPVTTAPEIISMTVLRASLDDSAWTVISRPEPRIE